MQYELTDNIAVITLDDGKANAVGPALLEFLLQSLDKAQEDKAGAVLLRGRPGMFSAGFDLKEFAKGMEAGMAMVGTGMEALIRLYSYPLPVVVACSGHGIAMGAFLIMACDTRIGARGDFRITLPETAISMEIPKVMAELAASRLAATHLTRAMVQAEVFSPDDAVGAGFLDEVVEPEELDARAMGAAKALADLPQEFYVRNKMLVRGEVLNAMHAALESATADSP